jgi:hypothetical protein
VVSSGCDWVVSPGGTALELGEAPDPSERGSRAGHAALCVDAVKLSPLSWKFCPTRSCFPALVLVGGRWRAVIQLFSLLARNRGQIDDKATCGVRKQVIRETTEHDYGCE